MSKFTFAVTKSVTSDMTKLGALEELDHDGKPWPPITVEAPSEEVARSIARAELFKLTPGVQRFHPAECTKVEDGKDSKAIFTFSAKHVVAVPVPVDPDEIDPSKAVEGLHVRLQFMPENAAQHDILAKALPDCVVEITNVCAEPGKPLCMDLTISPKGPAEPEHEEFVERRIKNVKVAVDRRHPAVPAVK